MEFALEWLHPSLLICWVSGAVTVEGCEALMQTVTSQPQFQSGISVLTVQTHVDVLALTAADIKRIADLNVQFADGAAVRSAIVVGRGSPIRYGLARMFEAYADSQKNGAVMVFETLDEAMAWLSEADAQSHSEPPEDGSQAPS